ncbi:MAG TPA: hypothetical protein PKE32_01015 [Miltoncostaeaceae bacterium]|nr:hypothetical protein [Miltoncostaeaceae bacterium]
MKRILPWTVAASVVCPALAGSVTVIPSAAHAAPSVPAPPWVIADGGPQGTTIAGLRIAPARPGVRAPRLRAAMARWGAPASQRRLGGRDACVSRWTRPRVAVVSANFGRLPAGVDACAGAIGFVQRIETIGAAWRTREGLAIGASRAELTARYPKARSAAEGDPGVLLLRPDLHPCRPCTSPARLHASLRGAVIAMLPAGRVRQLVVQVGAADQ